MEVPRPGVELELQPPPYATATLLTPQPQQLGIWAMSATHTPTHGNAGSLIHWVRPGIESESSWILGRFISAEPRWELLHGFIGYLFIFIEMSIQILCHLIFLLMSNECFLYSLTYPLIRSPYYMYNLRMLSPIPWVAFTLFNGDLWSPKVFNFDDVWLINYFWSLVFCAICVV